VGGKYDYNGMQEGNKGVRVERQVGRSNVKEGKKKVASTEMRQETRQRALKMINEKEMQGGRGTHAHTRARTHAHTALLPCTRESK
jgi:hypothetical protein